MILKIYRILTILGGPFILFYLNRRKNNGKEDTKRINERFGISTSSRPSGTLIWLHAASVGEAISMLQLIEKLLKKHVNCHLMITTGTVSSAHLMQSRLPSRAFHQYIPIDRPQYVRRFINHWRPDIALWVESEFWPNIIIETREKHIPMVLVNGRISTKSFTGWQRAPSLIKTLLQCFTLCLGQSDTDVQRLNRLGAVNPKNLGNLKFSAPPLPADVKALNNLQSMIGNRPVFIAVSTHLGEEKIIATVHKNLKSKHPDLLTIIIPRHSTRGPEILHTVQQIMANSVLRSKDGLITDLTDIYIADTMGELGLFYRLTEVVFMGKSLVPLGGQNPLEALNLNCAVLHGPHMTNFQSMSEQMIKLGCSIQFNNTEELAKTTSNLLLEQKKREDMIHIGKGFVNSQSEVVNIVAGEINKILMASHADT
jgi:3-deoxy-D-manno-octulosonic-acid transferase